MAVIQSDIALPAAAPARESEVRRYVRRHPTIVVGSVLLLKTMVAPQILFVQPALRVYAVPSVGTTVLAITPPASRTMSTPFVAETIVPMAAG